MKKKLIMILAALCASIFCFGFTYISNDELKVEIEQFSEKYYENVNRSIEAFDEAIKPYRTKTLEKDGRETIAYSENFGGVWVCKQGYLNIGVIGLKKETIAFNGHVTYRQQQFSYNNLVKLEEEIVQTAEKFDIEITASGIDEERNQVVFKANEEQGIKKLETYMKENGLIDESTVNFVVDSDRNIKDTAGPAYGGDRLNTQVLGLVDRWGTICVNALDNETGKYGILTNQHVAKNDNMYWNSPFGTLVGKATKSEYYGTIDAAFIPFDNQNNWSTTTHARTGSTTYTNIRLGSEDLIIQGLPIKGIGVKSGEMQGTIKMRDTGNTPINGKTKLFEIFGVKDGDSGGPIYFDGGGQKLFLIGMICAGDNLGAFACRITEVIRQFNITPVLNGTIFNTTNLSNNEIRIDNLIPTIPANPESTTVQFDIPSIIDGRKVTELGSSAFADQTNITNYMMPTDIKIIGNSAFANQTQLSQIIIPASVTSMGNNVFVGCNNLSITVQRASVPIAWSSNWNNNRPVTFTVPGGCGLLHNIKYEISNSSSHKKSCLTCGEFLLEMHSHNYTYIDALTHRKTCSLCPLSTVESHFATGPLFKCCGVPVIIYKKVEECHLSE